MNKIVERVMNGETVSFRPTGASMSGRIESGQRVTVAPVDKSTIAVDDIVLCSVNGHVYVHIVKAIGQDGRFLIGNNRGRINGWTRAVFGRVIKVEP